MRLTTALLAAFLLSCGTVDAGSPGGGANDDEGGAGDPSDDGSGGDDEPGEATRVDASREEVRRAKGECSQVATWSYTIAGNVTTYRWFYDSFDLGMPMRVDSRLCDWVNAGQPAFVKRSFSAVL